MAVSRSYSQVTVTAATSVTLGDARSPSVDGVPNEYFHIRDDSRRSEPAYGLRLLDKLGKPISGPVRRTERQTRDDHIGKQLVVAI
jgi:hypothetical protein